MVACFDILFSLFGRTCNRRELSDCMQNMCIVGRIPLNRVDQERSVGRYYMPALIGIDSDWLGFIVFANGTNRNRVRFLNNNNNVYVVGCIIYNVYIVVVPFHRTARLSPQSSFHSAQCPCRSSPSFVHTHPYSLSCAARHCTRARLPAVDIIWIWIFFG